MATGDDRRCPAAFAADGGGDGESATAIEDLPADVLALVLRRLDGASLAALGCACAAFRGLAADPDAWRALCLARWPSLRDVPPVDHKGHRQLFADAFPFPFPAAAAAVPAPSSAVPAGACSLPTRLVSAVDLYHGGACIMSRVVETDAASGWFLGAPFRVDALVQEGFSAPKPITPADLSLSWVLIDPATGRAVNASSRRPVSVDRRWLTGETVVRFAVVLGGGVALDAAVTCDERFGHITEVSLRIEDGEGGGVSGRDGLAVVAAAMAGARQGRGAEAAARLRYEEFVKGRAARKERKARLEGIVDLCCSGVGAAAFLGFLVMLTFR
ncbi:probable F-box protein At2g36090 [Panicum hallii]|uniref:probable F-box protein At2g36090 n=1 Tax=Panicum hallii TaxID=206008 RepID=UPI000DF4CE68|nr:probable F-box protein At2g36090 [Panicum hallii]